METFTVFCKMPDDREGEYSERFDVKVRGRSQTAAIRAAQDIIDREYDANLRPVHAVWRPTRLLKL